MAYPHRFQLPFFERFRAEIDPEALCGREIRPALTEPLLFTAKPSKHSGDLASTLNQYYAVLESAARTAGRLPPEKNLLGGTWVLGYDIYSPHFRRFIEIDERQHFSAPRLERIQRSRGSLIEANYPPYFWENTLPHLLEVPAHDYAPPYRDEQRAYLDLARELIPPQYGYEPTLRIDQWSVKYYEDQMEVLMGVLLGRELGAQTSLT